MRISLLLAVASLLVACGAGRNENAKEPEETIGAEIANDYNKAMDKARDIENLSLEAKDRMDAAVEEAQGTRKDKP